MLEHMIPTGHHDVAAAPEGPSAERVVLVPSVTIAGLFAVAFLAFPQQTGAWAQSLMAAIGTNFGWLYLAFGMVALGYCLWLAFGPHGSVKLGGADEPMEFSTPHWVAMMFTAGIGAGTVAWGFGEPIHYLETPPLGIEPYSSEAYEWAHMYPMLHWGIIPWAFYAVPAVPIAYALYVERAPFLRISEGQRRRTAALRAPGLESHYRHLHRPRHHCRRHDLAWHWGAPGLSAAVRADRR